MMKFTNFCGIFATVFVTTTIILLASCSQDDDYYESDMYTLAEMETRGGGGDPGNGGGTPDPPVPYNGNPVQEGRDTIKFDVEGCEMESFIHWTRGYTGMSAPVSEIAITLHYWDPDSASYVNSTGTWFGSNNGMKIRVDYIKDTIEIRELVDHTKDTVRYSLWKKFYHEYYPTCIPDPNLQPL